MSRLKHARRSSLRLEFLEDRLAPAIFTVTTTADVNNGATNGVSLREAILSANASAGADTINFNIPGGGVKTISPTSALPAVSGPTTIDGYTQPGSKANTLAVGIDAVLLIELNGAGAGTGAEGLYFSGGSNTVKGLVINRFYANGLAFRQAGNNHIEGNFIGTDPTGTIDRGNGHRGILISCSNNTVGGQDPAARNLISGNGIGGIDIFAGSFGNEVKGNWIGLDAFGTTAIPNDVFGVLIKEGSHDNTIGGLSVADRNVISGNNSHGIQIGSSSFSNDVLNNYIGTDKDGNPGLGNAWGGIAVIGGSFDNTISGNRVMSNAWDGIGILDSSNNTTGGATETERNIISGNGHSGIFITGATATGNKIQGNYIGTNAAGAEAFGNTLIGIEVRDSSNTTVVDNLISGNGSHGVQVSGASATGNQIRGNRIGTDKNGSPGLGNSGTGVSLIGGSSATSITGNRVVSNGNIGVNIVNSFSNTVGGSPASERNLISDNLAGVSINTGSFGNVVKGNWLGVDASGTGALPNAFDGVTIATGAHDNTIGGPNEADRNVIAANGGLGVQITTNSFGNVVRGNYIGADANGASLGNGTAGHSEVGIFNNCDNNTIQDNLILVTRQSGINVAPADSTGNTFSGNRILSTSTRGLTIDLQVYSDAGQVTLNDLGDADAGANNYQNFPFIAGVNTLGPDTFISGSLYSTPSTNFRLEFFAADTLSPTGHRQAQYLLGTLDVTTDATGLATFVFEHTGALPGPIVTATATNLATGDTSEFFNPSPPTNITLSNQTLPENAGANAPVGNLTTADADLGDAHAYTFVSGAGDTDNALFTIVGNQLRAIGSLNYEEGPTRSVRIRTTDLHGLFFGKAFTITITNVNEQPVVARDHAAVAVEKGQAASNTGTFSDQEGIGTVTLSASLGTVAGNADGTWTWTAPTGTLPVGTHTVTVTATDGSLAASTSFTLTVNPAATSATSSAPTITYGQDGIATVTVTSALGTVTGAATLSVDGGGPIAVTLVNGTASISLPGLTAGTHALVFTYATQGDFAASTATVSLTVNRATLTVTADDKSRVYGEANPTLTATIAGFVNGDSASAVTGAPALSTGATGTTAPGGYPIIAALGSLDAANYQFAFANGTLTVNQASTATAASVSAATPLFGVDGVTLTAAVSVVSPGSGSPTGTVSFFSGAALLGTANLVDGVATLVLGSTALPAGSHAISATYGGDAAYAGSAGSIATLAVFAPSTVQGLVYVDSDDDGQVDFGEAAVGGATVTLTGTDDLGNAVIRSVQTDSQGIYSFVNLRPSNATGYTVTETQPADLADGRDTLGTIGTTTVGSAAVNDTFSGVVLAQDGSYAQNYNFGERPASNGSVEHGQTATIGYWQNKNGQNLIKSLNGGSTATALGHWLAATFPNLYGSGAGANNLAGKTNAQVAAFYKQLFARTTSTSPAGPPKTDAQVMATAFAVYVTNQSLAGTAGAAYGFLVADSGVGSRTFNVGSNGAAFGVANGSTVSVMDLLLAVNARTSNGLLYDQNGNGQIAGPEVAYRTMANDLFSAINEAGDI